MARRSKEEKRRLRIRAEQESIERTLSASMERLQAGLEEKLCKEGREAVFTRTHPLKMSEVILEFAQPLLEFAQGYEEKRRAIDFAVATWNVSQFPEEDQEESIQQIQRFFFSDGLGPSYDERGLIQLFVERRELMFPNVKGIVLDYDVIQLPHGIHLNVITNIHKDSRR